MKAFLREYLDKHFPGVSRYYRKQRDRRLRMKTKTYRSAFGFTVQGDTSQHYSEGNADEARIHSHEIAGYLSLLKQVETVIDIGANIGMFTLLALKERKHVICVEPGTQNFRNLVANLHTNQFTDAEVYNCALSDQTSIQEFYGDGEMASLNEKWGNTEARYSELVCVNTLDNIVGERYEGASVLVKMDVEGFEYHVLQGAQSFLKRNGTTYWIIEHGLTENFPTVNPHYLDVFECFWSHGYIATTFDEENRSVTRKDVESWIENGKRSFGGINFLFSKTAS